ncbi:MAG: primosomal protein N' [Actinobacteria bacterium]|nr:primosomal protein N' [Actinomycetota bacterium]
MSFAHVAVPVPARAGLLFTYAIPPGMAVEPGMLVMVPFSSRVLPGIVVRLSSAAPDLPTRELLAVVESAPSISPSRLEVASWLAERYRNAPIDALSLFLPPGWLRAIVEQPRTAAQGSGEDVASPLVGDGSPSDDIRRPGTGASPRTWLLRWPAPAVVAETLLTLSTGSSDHLPDTKKRTGVWSRVVSLLEERGHEQAGVIVADAPCTLSTLRTLVTRGVLAISDQPDHPVGAGGSAGPSDDPHPPSLRFVRPLPEGEGRGEGVHQHSEPRTQNPTPSPFALSETQTAAYAPVATALASNQHQVFLLQGVTGSGKTHVYFRLIEIAIQLGRQAIVLLSEIAQTPEALERYAERFPGRVALLHSELPAGRRWELWRGIYDGRFDVVIGPRSALFAPVPDLGLIIMDEEHEPAYKQEDLSPRYHARDAAIELGKRTGAPVVLGSATPDIGSYYLAGQGVYQLLSLPERYAGPTSRGASGGKLPDVDVVDMRTELKTGNTSILSRSLQAGLERVLAAGEQAILFLNRRGASTAVVCRDCGHVLKCRRCEVALVYHAHSSPAQLQNPELRTQNPTQSSVLSPRPVPSSGALVCHQCNRESPLPEKCPRCKSRRISYFGAGTERVVEEVQKLFPSARVLRWDHDVVARQGGHSHIHEQFRTHQADVLVGTQMVAKALDFPLVTLVGVVLADVTLHLPEFRAAERTFQLLSQVAGRAGRGEVEGRVIIQTYSPDHYSIVAAARHDYEGFYRQELAFRRYHSYPPFRRLARLLFTGTGEVRARYEALQMKKRLQETVDELGIPDLELLGPSPAFHSRVRSRYRWQIVLAGDGLTRLLQSISLPRGWTVDVDPVSLL